jgi:hypothetical protein
MSQVTSCRFGLFRQSCEFAVDWVKNHETTRPALIQTMMKRIELQPLDSTRSYLKSYVAAQDIGQLKFRNSTRKLWTLFHSGVRSHKQSNCLIVIDTAQIGAGFGEISPISVFETMPDLIFRLQNLVE